MNSNIATRRQSSVSQDSNNTSSIIRRNFIFQYLRSNETLLKLFIPKDLKTLICNYCSTQFVFDPDTKNKVGQLKYSFHKNNTKIIIENLAKSLITESCMILLQPLLNKHINTHNSKVSVSFTLCSLPLATEGAIFGFLNTHYDFGNIAYHIDLKKFNCTHEFYAIKTGKFSKHVQILNQGRIIDQVPLISVESQSDKKNKNKNKKRKNDEQVYLPCIECNGEEEFEFEFILNDKKNNQSINDEPKGVNCCNVYFVNLIHHPTSTEKKRHKIFTFKGLSKEENIILYYCHSSYFTGEKSEIVCTTVCL